MKPPRAQASQPHASRQTRAPLLDTAAPALSPTTPFEIVVAHDRLLAAVEIGIPITETETDTETDPEIEIRRRPAERSTRGALCRHCSWSSEDFGPRRDRSSTRLDSFASMLFSGQGNFFQAEREQGGRERFLLNREREIRAKCVKKTQRDLPSISHIVGVSGF